MLSTILTAPLIVAALHATDIRAVYLLSPLIVCSTQIWLGSAAATIQDCMLPRMRGTAGAVFLCALSILGLGLGPYATGKLAVVAGSLKAGILSVLAIVPLALSLLWFAGRGIAAAEATRSERARAAGEND
jgi:hypothetical protein